MCCEVYSNGIPFCETGVIIISAYNKFNLVCIISSDGALPLL